MAWTSVWGVEKLRFDIIPPSRGHRNMPWERKSADTTYQRGYASRPGSPGRRVTEGHLRLTEKLLCDNAGTSCGSPRRGRPTGGQCHRRGSGPVVVGGVTTTQGAGERPAQGEGVNLAPSGRTLLNSDVPDASPTASSHSQV